MNSKNPALENSLACLQHPLTLLSIAILLLNDHVLKVVSPSWVTGKLSDFAGLFFFPFIVAAGLSLVLSKFNLSRQRVGQIAFGLVAVWFVLLKTVPFVNSLTAQFASLFIGAPARLILDPTDLIALVVLLPAWIIWKYQKNSTISKRAYVSLSIGVVACLATSPVPPPFSDVVALTYRDGILYAKSSVAFYLVRSTDKGDTWEGVGYSNDDWKTIDTALGERKLPIHVCDPAIQQTCYRIDGTDKVLVSNDGGQSWQIAWETPPERLEFISHISRDITTYDLIIAAENGSRYLFVAMGNNGILRRQLPDGEWIRLGVEKAQPAPFYAPTFGSAIGFVIQELIIWIGVAFLALLISSVAIWNRLPGQKSFVDLTDWLSLTVLFTFAFVLVEVALAFAVFVFQSIGSPFLSLLPKSISELLFVVATGLAIIAPFVWNLMRFNKWILKTAPDHSARPKIILYCALTVISVFLIGSLAWPLWALGVIASYQLALTTSIVVSCLITISGYYLIRNAN
jgi:hypothetical protein